MPSREGGKEGREETRNDLSGGDESISVLRLRAGRNDVISQRGGENGDGDNGMGQKMCEEERDLGWMTALLQRKRARERGGEKQNDFTFFVSMLLAFAQPGLFDSFQ